jgi:methionyl-tRNA formyltransferase
MNITILANRDLASCIALNHLVSGLSEHRATVFLSSRVGSKPLAPPLQQLKFVEQDLLNQIIAPLLNRTSDAQRAAKQSLLSFEQLGEIVAGGVSDLNNINEAAGLARFATSEPDLVMSIRYGLILKDPVIAIPTHSILNLHSGVLPDYKGVMASFWALFNGETEIGTTLHFIEDSSIDTGGIIASTRLSVQRDRSYLWHVLSLYEAGCEEMLAAVDKIAVGHSLPSHSQADSGNYYTFPNTEDLQRFNERGWRLFDPEDVLDVARQFVADDQLL